MLCGPVREMVEERCQAQIGLHEEPKRTVNVFADGWQSCSNVVEKVVEDDFATLTSVAHAALNAFTIPAPDSKQINPYQRYAPAEFKYSAAPCSPRAASEPKST